MAPRDCYLTFIVLHIRAGHTISNADIRVNPETKFCIGEVPVLN